MPNIFALGLSRLILNLFCNFANSRLVNFLRFIKIQRWILENVPRNAETNIFEVYETNAKAAVVRP